MADFCKTGQVEILSHRRRSTAIATLLYRFYSRICSVLYLCFVLSCLNCFATIIFEDKISLPFDPILFEELQRLPLACHCHYNRFIRDIRTSSSTTGLSSSLQVCT